jgi:putative membrane protein
LENNQDKFTIVGTNIDEVKRQNVNSGMTYNELNEWFAKQMKNNSKSLKNIHSVNQGNDK